VTGSVAGASGAGATSVVNDTNVTGSITSNVLTLGWTGNLSVARGGTGAASLTGLVLGNGTSPMTATTTSAGISGAISDETGSGSLVFATAPTVTTLTVSSGGIAVSGNSTIATTAGNTATIGNTTGILTLTGSAGSTFALNGVTVDATEFNRLDGKDAALVDTNDAVTTAIIGTVHLVVVLLQLALALSQLVTTSRLLLRCRVTSLMLTLALELITLQPLDSTCVLTVLTLSLAAY
jgi:hypothetical protein